MRYIDAYIGRDIRSGVSDRKTEAGFRNDPVFYRSVGASFVHPFRGMTLRLGMKAMTLWAHITGYAAAIREFVAPTYRPERHYMRGPGPAHARRQSKAVEASVTIR